MTYLPLFLMATGLMSIIMNLHVLGALLLILCLVTLGGAENARRR
jgi:ABC-type multidrug transport system permease subunit